MNKKYIDEELSCCRAEIATSGPVFRVPKQFEFDIEGYFANLLNWINKRCHQSTLQNSTKSDGFAKGSIVKLIVNKQTNQGVILASLTFRLPAFFAGLQLLDNQVQQFFPLFAAQFEFTNFFGSWIVAKIF